MPSSKFRKPKYCLHKQSGRARVRVDGKYELLPGKYNSRESRQAYQRIVDELASEHKDELEPVAGDCILAELMALYLSHAKAYYYQGGESESESDHISRCFAPLENGYLSADVDSIDPRKWKDIRQYFVDNGQTRSGVNKSMARLLRMFRWGVEEGLVKVNTYQSLKLVAPLKFGRCEAPESREVEAVKAEHVEAIKPHVSPTIWAMIQVQMLSGMRPGELCKLVASELDTSDDDAWTYSPASHKNAHRKKKRLVFLGPRAQAFLSPYLTSDQAAYLFSPQVSARERLEKQRSEAKSKLYGKRKADIESRGLGNVSRMKSHYTVASYRQVIKRACKSAGVPSWTPYQLRHRAGEDARAAAGIEGTSALLGNSIDAAQIYAEKNEALGKKLAKQFG